MNQPRLEPPLPGCEGEAAIGEQAEEHRRHAGAPSHQHGGDDRQRQQVHPTTARQPAPGQRHSPRSVPSQEQPPGSQAVAEVTECQQRHEGEVGDQEEQGGWLLSRVVEGLAQGEEEGNRAHAQGRDQRDLQGPLAPGLEFVRRFDIRMGS